MFKEILSSLNKFSGKRWIPIGIIILIAALFFYYSSSKTGVLDKMTLGDSGAPLSDYAGSAKAPSAHGPTPSDSKIPHGSGYALQPVANPSDLLPSDQNSQWAALNPIGNGNVALPDLLQAGYHIGLDTIGQTLKNANYQLRSDPLIEKKDIGPWNQSTYEPDYGRVPLEIGSAGK